MTNNLNKYIIIITEKLQVWVKNIINKSIKLSLYS